MEPLAYSEKPELSVDTSAFRELRFLSESDGTEQTVDLYLPLERTNQRIGLLIAPHPMTWTAREDYSGGLPDLKRKFHRGYHGLASKYGIAIAMPHGHHRKSQNASLAFPPQIDDLASVPRIVNETGILVDESRVYACGLSMGGQEALVLAGRYPQLLAAVVAFSPIVDLVAWHDDMESSVLPEIMQYGTTSNIENEVGGKPSEARAEYEERSPIKYLAGISHVPALLFWSDKEAVVPRQLTHHSYRLYKEIKATNPSSPIVEYNHTFIHGVDTFTAEAMWMLHEWCDYEWAVQWLIQHAKAGNVKRL